VVICTNLQKKKHLYIVGIIILVILMGEIFLYRNNHTIQTTPYHPPAVAVPLGGGSTSNTGTSITQTTLNPTPFITTYPQPTPTHAVSQLRISPTPHAAF
jgi:hypothetical protein